MQNLTKYNNFEIYNTMTKYPNQTNNKSTNIFETWVGSLNLAPIKISGQYKIVVTINGKLFFDDYTGRRISIDVTKPFIPQLSSFLQVKSEISDTTVLQYGCFQNSTTKSFHTPIYLGNKKYPDSCIIKKVLNETLTDTKKLYNDGSSIIQYVDLSKSGLYKIFDEIFEEDYFEYPLYFDWLDGYVQLYGLDVNKNQPVQKTLDLQYSRANQPYFENVNNLVLNTYANNGIIFPKFINIEFEFDYKNDYIAFNNIFGFLAYNKEVQSIDANQINYKIKDFNTSIQYSQQFISNTLTLDNYQVINARASVQEISKTLPQIKYKLARIDVGDIISIYHPNGELEFQYAVSQSDIDVTSLFATLTNIVNSANQQSGLSFIFSVEDIDTKYCMLKIVNNVNDSLNEDYVIDVPLYFNNIDRFVGSDNFNKFRGITENDVWLTGNPNLLDTVTSVLINSQVCQIVEKYKFNGRVILRLDNVIIVDGLTSIDIYETKTEKLYIAEPIPYYDYNSDLECLTPFDQSSYVAELRASFISDIAVKSIDDFASKIAHSTLQYALDTTDNSQMDMVNKVERQNYNTSQVSNMIFSTGSTSFLTPNTFTIDKSMYLQNGNIDINQLEIDFIKYNWFLIKGQCPKYLQNDIRSLRYFTDRPKLTSKLIRNGDLCETVFLGVKYQLPEQYTDYEFATYLNFTDKRNGEISYKFEVYNSEKIVYLSINKYLDFGDLLYGGDEKNVPLLDLSFFYATTKSYNSTSDNIGSFLKSSLFLCHDFSVNPIQFDTVTVYDWKYLSPVNNTWYIALKLNQMPGYINNFREIFKSQPGEQFFYFYSTFELDGQILNFASTTIKLLNVVEVTETILWCEDIQFQFFDTKQILLSKYNINTKTEDIFYPEKKLTNIQYASNNLFDDYVGTADILIEGTAENFKLITPDKYISFKDWYFEIEQHITFANGIENLEKTIFQFPNSKYIQKFPNTSEIEILSTFDSPDNATYDYKITLFDRNQIWRVIKELLVVNLKFKNYSESTVKRILDEFTVSNLMDVCQTESLSIVNPEGNDFAFIQLTLPKVDFNTAIWNMLGKKTVTLFNRIQGCYSPCLQLADSEIKFQLPKYQTNSSLFNIYDSNFGGAGINATGLWAEVKGNIVSSLFCKSTDYTISINNNQLQIFDVLQLLINVIEVEQCIINNDNADYISKINKNVSAYIKQQYCKYLLDNFYNLSYVADSEGNRIKFTNLLNYQISTDTIYQSLIFVFSRK